MTKDLKYWLAFSLFSQIGPVKFKRLYNYFPSMEEAWNAPLNELVTAGLEKNIAQEFLIQRKKINPDFELEKVNQHKIGVVTLQDEAYPKLLKEIYDPPFLLYYKGNLSEEEEILLAVVGSRKFTNYGKNITLDIVSSLAQNNITIVSGLALGIDTLAHQAALKEKGRTIAVLGSGLDNIYPFSNIRLAEEIIHSFGTLFSEYPLGTPPLKQNFPQRNRIISGLALGTLVIEAGERSGALITARSALEQNREVLAVPGSIYNPASQGTNNLIKWGAKIVTKSDDILDALNLTQVTTLSKNKKIIPETKEEEIILNILSKEPIHIDKLVEISKLDIATLNSVLMIMEMRGKVKNLGGNNYILTH